MEGSDASCVWLSYFSLGQPLQHSGDVVPAVRYPLLFLSSVALCVTPGLSRSCLQEIV